MTRRARTCFLGAVVAVTLLAGCGGGDDTSDSSATSDRTSHGHRAHGTSTTDGANTDGANTDSPSDVATTEAADGPAFPAGTAAQEQKNSGDWDLVLTDVRVGSHEGYDRIVAGVHGHGRAGLVGEVASTRPCSTGAARPSGSAATRCWTSTHPAPPTRRRARPEYQGPQHFARRRRRRRRRRLRRWHVRGLHAGARRARRRPDPVPGVHAHRPAAAGGRRRRLRAGGPSDAGRGLDVRAECVEPAAAEIRAASTPASGSTGTTTSR